ncbi:MAG: ribonuclease E, partial [Cyanobacteriota bacterium]|nr:ribonuclease E [Cyanobacteriota bacterium]
GTLGLNPILLLDEPPESENVMVRVVRPGEDPDAVLEHARQQLASSAGRRRRRGGRGGRGATRGNGGSSSSASLDSPAVAVADRAAVEEQPLMVEITPLEALQTVVRDEVAPTPTSTPMPDAVVDTPEAFDEESSSEEPRRRRRRSSASSAPD